MIAISTHKPSKLLSLLLMSGMCVLLFSGCKNKAGKAPNDLHFELVKSSHSNIDFNNKITESDSINVYKNEYMYNGSGVATADFNNDGLQDVFFCGSMVSSKLYINKGNFVFEDITSAAGLTTDEWCTGVSVVDINNDGYQDIYVCTSHAVAKENRINKLFINDGKLHFTEQATAYGLADTGYSTQAAFVDYDKDGDLDIYLLNHRLYNRNPNNLVPKSTSGTSPAQDRLYRNEGVQNGSGHPVYKDVSLAAGIQEDGYGLGVAISDINNDNWPDIYVANDYIGNDLLWLNNHDGTFTNTIATSIKHQSYNSMGVDAADINNDGLTDIGVLDMSPENNDRKKMMFMATGQEKYDMERRLGYEPSFVRNVLQLNNGNRNIEGKEKPFFSEIGQYAGISETDWSWSILFVDVDNDGYKDVHITNGLAKDVTNNDYVAFKNSQNQHSYDFTAANNAGAMDVATISLLRKNLDQYGSVKVNNYFYRNNANCTFENNTEAAGLALPSISNGAAYADLDNDGDMDMVVNNMNQEAFVWRNELRTSITDSLHNFLGITLHGPANNKQGIAAKVWLYNKVNVQYLEQNPVRGFCSSVDERLHFGLDKAAMIDSIKVQWPDDKMQVIENIKPNQYLTLGYKNARVTTPSIETSNKTWSTDVAAEINVDFVHKESQYFDFGSQRGVPQRYSQLGPCIATGDINGDGLEDFFVGGAARQSGKIFIQNNSGKFAAEDLVTGLKDGEDVGAVFFDSDGDKDLDLLITGGSQEYGENASSNALRLFTNDGKGQFSLSAGALPANIADITQVSILSDYDHDGDKDIFVGGRMVPQHYPSSPRSYLLENNNGKFTDVTHTVCPELEYAGLLTGAVFTDINNDNQPDLIVCGEWMPIRFFENHAGKFIEVTKQVGLTNMQGQWRSLQAADIDNDGDTDLIAGNLGMNNKFHIGDDRPMELFAGDFDGNKTIDLITAFPIKNKENKYELFPGIDRNQLADAIPSIKKLYLLHSTFASLTMKELLKNLPAEGMVEKKCETTASVWLENDGKGHYIKHELPMQAQFAPVNSIIADDFDNDGIKDLLLAGNEYQTDVSTGRYDASYSVLLKGRGKGVFDFVPNTTSGVILDGDVKDLKTIHLKGDKKMILAAVNDSRLRCFGMATSK